MRLSDPTFGPARHRPCSAAPAPPSRRTPPAPEPAAEPPGAAKTRRTSSSPPQARGESPGRADRDHRARHADARRAPGRQFRRLCPLRAEPLLPLARAGLGQRLFPRRRLGENANHSASLPSVGTYLDEQPITTTTGALDSTSTTSPGSRLWPGRRARSTAPPARPARSGSSPTSPISPASTAPPMSS